MNTPSVRELPLEKNESCLELIRDLVEDNHEALVLTTGVGLQYLIDASASVGLEAQLLDALARVKTVSRGPKPAAVLRKYQIKPTVNVPEPNTWREVAEAIKKLPATTAAIQEYGVSNPEFVARLESQGMVVKASPVYRWALPEDVDALRAAARTIANGECDIALFLSSVQLTHLLQIAEEEGLREQVLSRLREFIVIASIGPVMTDALLKQGLAPDFTPKHPKLAVCVRQLSAVAQNLVAEKRSAIP